MIRRVILVISVLGSLLSFSMQGQLESTEDILGTETVKKSEVGYSYPMTQGRLILTVALDAWSFVGPAFKYRNSIKLLSDRLPNQLTMAASMARITGGDTWNLTMEFIVKAEDHQRGEGFALWISKKDVFGDMLDLLAGSKSDDYVLGFSVKSVSTQGRFEGFGVGVVVNKTANQNDTHYFSRSFDGIMDKNEMLYNCMNMLRSQNMQESDRFG